MKIIKFGFAIPFICSFLFLPITVMAETVTEEWVKRYDGPTNSSDGGHAIAVDGAGNIYVAGYSYGILNVDYYTIKYDTNGNELWANRYNGPANGHDIAADIALDSAGNAYITGRSTESSRGYTNYATIKYDTNGNKLWAKSYNGLSNGFDTAYAIAVDNSGNAYVTGASGNDYATVKYDTNGNELWVKRYSGYSYDVPTAIAVDDTGNVYVTGISSNSGNVTDYATIKYDTNGNELWIKRYNGPTNSTDSAYAIIVDSAGNAYITGRSVGSESNYDYATLKYDTNGNELWVKRYNGPTNSSDEAFDIALDGSGNIYVTGRSYSVESNHDYATIKYDANGNELWVKNYNGPRNGHDMASDIAVDGAGNVYVTGWSFGNEFLRDFATVKYDTNGNKLWAKSYNGPADNADRPYDIAVDSAGNTYVTGFSRTGSYDDLVTIKYSSEADADGDGVLDVSDNCVNTPNSDQSNHDSDDDGDACDSDDDNDGVNDDVPDNCPLTPNPNQLNTDGDAQGNACDL